MPPYPQATDEKNIHLRPLSRDGFHRDLISCHGVISNAGFELASEAIHLGKKILVKPLKGQMEQLSNALALEKLCLGVSMDTLDAKVVDHWLHHFHGKQVIYPNVAGTLAEWIASGQWECRQPLIDTLWKQVLSSDIKDFNRS